MALSPFPGICWLQIVVAGWEGEGKVRREEAAASERNSATDVKISDRELVRAWRLRVGLGVTQTGSVI